MGCVPYVENRLKPMVVIVGNARQKNWNNGIKMSIIFEMVDCAPDVGSARHSEILKDVNSA